MGDAVAQLPPVLVVLAIAMAPLAALIGAWFGRTSSREQNRSADWEAHAKALQDHRKAIEEWTEKRLAERDKRITQLESEVRDLAGILDRLRRKYEHAIRYIIYLVAALRAHVPADEIAPPPSDISEDIDLRGP